MRLISGSALLHSATALLHSATELLIHVAAVQCFDTFVQSVPYLRVPIVLRPSHLLLLVYASKHLYDKYLNNEIYENKVISFDVKGYLSSVM